MSGDIRGVQKIGKFMAHQPELIRTTESGLMVHRWKVDFGNGNVTDVVTRAKTMEAATQYLYAMGEEYGDLSRTAFQQKVKEAKINKTWYSVVMRPSGDSDKPGEISLAAVDPKVNKLKILKRKQLTQNEIDQVHNLSRLYLAAATGTKQPPSDADLLRLAARGGYFAPLLDDLEKPNRDTDKIKREIARLERIYTDLMTHLKNHYGGDEDTVARNLDAQGLDTTLGVFLTNNLSGDDRATCGAIAGRIGINTGANGRESIGGIDIVYRELKQTSASQPVAAGPAQTAAPPAAAAAAAAADDPPHSTRAGKKEVLGGFSKAERPLPRPNEEVAYVQGGGKFERVLNLLTMKSSPRRNEALRKELRLLQNVGGYAILLDDLNKKYDNEDAMLNNLTEDDLAQYLQEKYYNQQECVHDIQDARGKHSGQGASFFIGTGDLVYMRYIQRGRSGER